MWLSLAHTHFFSPCPQRSADAHAPCTFDLSNQPGSGEAVLHIGVETFALDVGMPLWGWASDNLRSRYGTFIFCVRPAAAPVQLPAGAGPMPTCTGGSSRSKLFGGVDINAVIDILCEPLGEDSVRFAFQMTDTVPAFVPSWMINYIMQGAMVKVYGQMRAVAESMARNDPSCSHVRHVGKPAYAPTRQWYADKLSSFLGSADFAQRQAHGSPKLSPTNPRTGLPHVPTTPETQRVNGLGGKAAASGAEPATSLLQRLLEPCLPKR